MSEQMLLLCLCYLLIFLKFADNITMMQRFYFGQGKICLPLLFGFLLFGTLSRIYAAPLEGGYAPVVASSPEEKASAFREARFKLLAAAAKYENTPYRYGGIDRNGIDCSGLVYTSFKDALSVSVPRTTTGLYAWVEKIATEKLQPGDLVFFKTTGPGVVSHVGIYAGDNRFIHSASEGPVTGVMYSGLGESYWARTYTGAGRALPAADINTFQGVVGQRPGTEKPVADNRKGREGASGKNEQKSENILFGFAIAPTWNSFFANGNIVRGAASQFRLVAKTDIFSRHMILGLELRPEWDGALGVFRLPITFTWAFNDKLSFFVGPAFSFGDAVLKTPGGNRHYASGSNLFGALGITAAPFAIKTARGELAPYGEFAWQSYLSKNNQFNLNADFAAGFRFSTGLRYTWKAPAWIK
jgi:probable lipoprotein NlpC